MIDLLDLTEHILRRTGFKHRTVSVVEMNRSTADRIAIAVMAFVDDRPDPALFLKATPDPEGARLLQQEYATLARLHECGGGLEQTIPRPLHLGDFERYTVLAESGLGGSRMKNQPPTAYFASRAFRSHFAGIIDWLGTFHECPVGELPVAPIGDDGSDRAADALERYRRAFECSDALDRLLDAVRDRLEGRSFPRTPWHGDFCSANIMVRPDGGVGIIDWENPLVRSWPLLDLVYCLSSVWCTRYRKGLSALAGNYRHLLFQRHHLTDLIRERTIEYAERVGVDGADVAALSILAWVIYANRKHRSLEAEPGADGGPVHWPLIMFDSRRCLNLELIAENRREYVLDLG